MTDYKARGCEDYRFEQAWHHNKRIAKDAYRDLAALDWYSPVRCDVHHMGQKLPFRFNMRRLDFERVPFNRYAMEHGAKVRVLSVEEECGWDMPRFDYSPGWGVLGMYANKAILMLPVPNIHNDGTVHADTLIDWGHAQAVLQNWAKDEVIYTIIEDPHEITMEDCVGDMLKQMDKWLQTNSTKGHDRFMREIVNNPDSGYRRLYENLQAFAASNNNKEVNHD